MFAARRHFGCRRVFAAIKQCLAFAVNKRNFCEMESNFNVIQKGTENDTSFRLFYCDKQNVPISPFHDIPLFADQNNQTYNMVVEIPRWTNAKMEIATKEPLNPIKQDVKNGELRYVKNCFPHRGYIWNYGALPQTWENPKHLDESTGCKGDNDPIDVCEIGARVHQRGAVIQVKLLGCFALIDEGETDWKIMAIDVNDPLAPYLSDIEDVNRHMPGLLRATQEWFKIYKIPDGKKANEFAFNGEAKNREFAHKIVSDTHKYWKELVSSPTNESGLDLTNVTLSFSPYKIDDSDSILKLAPEKSEPKEISDLEKASIDKWYYVSLS
ncbi:Inorganic pyrophosphatase-like protein [Dinothrombium tinctorium]|uniref:Inorganic pyrophosphatase n=1 Tax=Dinothrombium tinctorium TaxID=1965070 RepID=A0A3S3QTM8_9ACAR|nr:Inorganic pyrophosphatase-like protein [Dinothrombium tinctorium]